jgi:type IV secretory pathway TraG/TraD family ATPase VirD4
MVCTQIDLESPFIEITDETGKTDISIRSAFESFFICGATGSGKSTSSGALIAKKFLQLGYGGLVLTAKPDERRQWEYYAEKTGRAKDLIIVEPGGKHSFDFLEYISNKNQSKSAYAENIVHTLTTIIRSSEEKSSGKSDDPFWESSQNILIHNVIDLCLLAYGSVSIQHLYEIVMSAPKSDDDSFTRKRKTAFTNAFDLAKDNVDAQVEVFTASLTPEQKVKLESKDEYEKALLKAIPDAVTLKFLDQFFMESYRDLSEKTRSIIEFSFSGFLFRLLKEPVHSLFCNYVCTFKPEDCIDGKIILLDLPVKLYHKVGRDIQVLFKYLFQQAMEKREINDHTEPTFLFADEAQHFLHEYDADFLATSRSSRIITCYITQNLPNLHANIGGLKSEQRVQSLLGNLGTKIFHANSCMETNRYASNLFGKGYMDNESSSLSLSDKFSSSHNHSFVLEDFVRPEEFQLLMTGGPRNHFLTQAYVHRQDQAFPDGLPFRKVIFLQHLK